MAREQFEVRADGVGYKFVCRSPGCTAEAGAFTSAGAANLGRTHVAKHHRPPLPDPTSYYAIIKPRLLLDGFAVECSGDRWSSHASNEAECQTLWTAHANIEKHT